MSAKKVEEKKRAKRLRGAKNSCSAVSSGKRRGRRAKGDRAWNSLLQKIHYGTTTKKSSFCSFFTVSRNPGRKRGSQPARVRVIYPSLPFPAEAESEILTFFEEEEEKVSSLHNFHFFSCGSLFIPSEGRSARFPAYGSELCERQKSVKREEGVGEGGKG